MFNVITSEEFLTRLENGDPEAIRMYIRLVEAVERGYEVPRATVIPFPGTDIQE